MKLFFSSLNRDLLGFIYIPIIQRELDIFKDTVWNGHRIRKQRDAQLPKGVPNHVYAFPERYDAEDCGMLNQHIQSFILNFFK